MLDVGLGREHVAPGPEVAVVSHGPSPVLGFLLLAEHGVILGVVVSLALDQPMHAIDIKRDEVREVSTIRGGDERLTADVYAYPPFDVGVAVHEPR